MMTAALLFALQTTATAVFDELDAAAPLPSPAGVAAADLRYFQFGGGQRVDFAARRLEDGGETDLVCACFTARDFGPNARRVAAPGRRIKNGAFRHTLRAACERACGPEPL